MQSGAPYGRYISVLGCSATVTSNCLNYGTQLVLAEPIGTPSSGQRDACSTSVLRSRFRSQRARIGLFFDLFNTFNSNTAVNLMWQSAATNNRFERASTVLGPRIAKFGVKFDW